LTDRLGQLRPAHAGAQRHRRGHPPHRHRQSLYSFGEQVVDQGGDGELGPHRRQVSLLEGAGGVQREQPVTGGRLVPDRTILNWYRFDL
jgi:hypothetical protein